MSKIEIPDGWIEEKLNNLGDIFCGQSPQGSAVNFVGLGTPYVSGPDQWNGHQVELNKWTTEPKRIVPGNSIFITVKGAGFGTIFPGVQCIIGRDIYAFCPNHNLDTKFIEHAISYNIQSMKRNAVGDIPGLSKSHIADHSVFLPPIKEQQQIVSALEDYGSRLDEAVMLLERVQRNLKRYRASVMKAAVEGRLVPTEAELARAEGRDYEPASFLLDRILAKQHWKETNKNIDQIEPDKNNLNELPQGWCWTQIGTVGRVQLGRQRSPKNHTGPHMRPYLRVANVFEDRIDTSDILEMNFSPAEYEIYRLHSGDILLNEGQSPHLVGRPAMYRGEVPGACFQNTLVRFRAGFGVEPQYALIVFLSHLHSLRYLPIAKITTNIAHLGAERFANVEFPLPPLEEQKRIIQAVEQKTTAVDSAEKIIRINLSRCTRFRQSILKHAFDGKLVDQDPADEPASVLLERIREERAAATTKAKPRTLRRKA